MPSQIIIGNALTDLKHLPSESVNCCITSPPYYGLRDYGVDDQIGLEETVEEYIDKLRIIFGEVFRIIKPDGTLWLNIADSYFGSGKGRNSDGSVPDSIYHCKEQSVKGRISGNLVKNCTSNYKPKDLMGIPWLLAMALRFDGWYLRQDIIWHKTNVMPESVKDRCTRSHEYIFLLSKSKHYYYDFKSIKEPCVGFDRSSPRGSKGTAKPNSGRRKGNRKTFRGGGVYTQGQSFCNSVYAENDSIGNTPNETGLRNKRDVWSIATSGYKDAHFATFPQKLIEPCVLAGCPVGGIVLDPFLGSGTTGEVAIKNGRNFIGMELNPEYAKLAAKRTGIEITGGIYNVKQSNTNGQDHS